MAYLALKNISKSFNGHWALEKIHLEISKGETLCLLGPSGCGKTTLLRIIAGLTAPDSGRILLDGRDLSATPPHARRFGMMFQEFALFPHKNVRENVAFGLKMQRMDRIGTDARVREMLELVGLTGFEERDVAELSGGERQRVALARSLAPHPQLLMLDEPLGALDRALRQRLMMDLLTILNHVNVTTIFVTHDQTEAFAVSDRIAVMHAGRIEQIDSPERIYNYPVNRRVARFLGFENLLPGRVIDTGIVETELGKMAVDTHNFTPADRIVLLVRPMAAVPVGGSEHMGGDTIVIQGVVMNRLFLGTCCRLRLNVGQGAVLAFDLPNSFRSPEPGDSIKLRLNPAEMVLIASD